MPDGSGPEYVNNALSGCLDFLPSVPTSEKKFSLLQQTYSSGKNVEETVAIDGFSGKDVSVQIDYDLSGPFTVSVDFNGAPSDTDIDKTDTLVIDFDSVPSGSYSVRIASKGSGKINFLTLLVTSRAQENVEPIVTNCWSSAGQEDVDIGGDNPDKLVIYGQATQGSSPVLNADIRALLKADNEEELMLKDDGVAPDAIKNDGIYSAYYIAQNTNANSKTRYSLVCKIEGTNETSTVDNEESKKGKTWLKGKSLPSQPSSTTPMCCGSVGVAVSIVRVVINAF